MILTFGRSLSQTRNPWVWSYQKPSKNNFQIFLSIAFARKILTVSFYKFVARFLCFLKHSPDREQSRFDNDLTMYKDLMETSRHVKPRVQINKESSHCYGKILKFLYIDSKTKRYNLKYDVKSFYQIFVDPRFTWRNSGILKKTSCRIPIIHTTIPWL